jgi:hypothetical protein
MQKGFKSWFMERGYKDGRRTDHARYNLLSLIYVFVRRSVSSGEHSVPGADDGRVGSKGGIVIGGGKPKCSKNKFSQ